MTTTYYTLSTESINSNSSSYATIPELQFSATSGVSYYVEWHGAMSMSGGTSGGTTGGIKFKFNAPTVDANIQFFGNNTLATTFRSNVLHANGDITSAYCQVSTTEMIWSATGVIDVTTTGVVSLGFKPVTASEVAYILKNSSLTVTSLT